MYDDRTTELKNLRDKLYHAYENEIITFYQYFTGAGRLLNNNNYELPSRIEDFYSSSSTSAFSLFNSSTYNEWIKHYGEELAHAQKIIKYINEFDRIADETAKELFDISLTLMGKPGKNGEDTQLSLTREDSNETLFDKMLKSEANAIDEYTELLQYLDARSAELLKIISEKYLSEIKEDIQQFLADEKEHFNDIANIMAVLHISFPRLHTSLLPYKEHGSLMSIYNSCLNHNTQQEGLISTSQAVLGTPDIKQTGVLSPDDFYMPVHVTKTQKRYNDFSEEQPNKDK